MKSNRARFLGLCAVALVAFGLPSRPAGAAVPTEGDLDAGFGGAGVASTVVGSASAVANAVAIQADGKIVAVGQASGTNGDFAVVRYTTAGVPDPTFGTGGIVLTDFGSGNDVARAVAIQPDGMIVVVGSASNGTNDDFAIVRYTSGGSLDSSFGINGKATFGIGSGLDRGTAMALEPDGKIIVAGYFFNGLVNRFAVLRYTAAGGLDSSFNGVGYETGPEISPEGEFASGVALLSNGDIAVAGTAGLTDPDFAVALYHPNGGIDTGFGSGGGFVDIDVQGNHSVDFARAITVQPDDRILVAGSTTNGLAVARVTPTGALDPAFDGSGVSFIDDNTLGKRNEDATGLALQNDGRIVVAGSDLAITKELTVHRLTADGGRDLDFGDQGVVAINPAADDAIGTSVAVQTDGKIVVAGTDLINSHFAVARLIGDLSAPWGEHVFGLPHYLLGPHSASWLAFDSGTGVKKFDVRREVAKATAGAFGSWLAFKVGTARPYDTLPFGTPGTTACLEARGIDFAGNVGQYSRPMCTAFPLGPGALTRHGSWTVASSGSFYRGVALSSKTAGATLTTPAYYRRLAVVVTTCPGCGVLKIYRNTIGIATINLNAAKVTRRKVIEISVSPTIQHAMITLKQASNGKPVIIEGLGIELG